MDDDIAIFAKKIQLNQKQHTLLIKFINKLKKHSNDNKRSRNQNCDNFASEIRPFSYRWERLGLEFIILEKDMSAVSKKIAQGLRTNFPEPSEFTSFATAEKQKKIMYVSLKKALKCY